MMKQTISTCFLLIILSSISYAACDLKIFGDRCELMPKQNSNPRTKARIYCQNRILYITEEEYLILNQYHRMHQNLSLNFNNKFLEGPCIVSRSET